MTGNALKPSPSSTTTTNHKQPSMPAQAPLEWDWDVEHEDRRHEKQADAALHNALPFLVDRSVLKDVVREKFSSPVARIKFLSAGVSPPARCCQVD